MAKGKSKGNGAFNSVYDRIRAEVAEVNVEMIVPPPGRERTPEDNLLGTCDDYLKGLFFLQGQYIGRVSACLAEMQMHQAFIGNAVAEALHSSSGMGDALEKVFAPSPLRDHAIAKLKEMENQAREASSFARFLNDFFWNEVRHKFSGVASKNLTLCSDWSVVEQIKENRSPKRGRFAGIDVDPEAEAQLRDILGGDGLFGDSLFNGLGDGVFAVDPVTGRVSSLDGGDVPPEIAEIAARLKQGTGMPFSSIFRRHPGFRPGAGHPEAMEGLDA